MINDSLKNFLADTYTLALKTQNFHWNVISPEFFSLHKLFEKQYEDLFGAADMIAERIRALGDHAPGGLKAYAKLTTIEDAPESADADTMLILLSADHEKLAESANKLVEKAVNTGDNSTADILIERIKEHEKQVWMMRAILGPEHFQLEKRKKQVA